MPCPSKLVELPCNKSGVGFTSAPYTTTSTTLQLQTGNGAMFPVIPPGKHFYARIYGCNCCAEVKVTAIVGDTMTVAPLAGAGCNCIPSVATVKFTESSRAAMSELMIEAIGALNFTPPLKFDCATKTVSIDCATMKSGCAPCAA